MKRNLLLILVALLPLLSNAYDYIVETGVCHLCFILNKSDATATVTYNSEDDRGYFGNVVIPASFTVLEEKIDGTIESAINYRVTGIGADAFAYCSSLTSVTIPNSVTSIGNYAFRGCSGLTSVTIPESVTSIGNYAFRDCSGLTSITIGSGLTSIGNSAFSGCTNITSMSLDCEDIGSWVPANKNLKTLTLGDNVKTIGYNAFSGCSSLTSLTIPNSVTSIGDYAFSGCSGLTSATIGSGLTSIGTGVFSGCTGLASIKVETGNTKYDSRNACNAIIETASNTLIMGCKKTTIPNSVTSIGSSAFSGCSGLTSVTIGSDVTSIGDYAFYFCSGLTSLTIPNSVTNIGSSAFWGCSGLTSLTIPNSVTSIGDCAFRDCSGLTSATIGSGVTYIGDQAFNESKPRNVLIKCTTPPEARQDEDDTNGLFSTGTFFHTILYVPTGSWDAYAYHDAWCHFINIRETAMTEEELSVRQTYTLMDANTFAYSVYDPVNDCIGTVSSVGINEDNLNHSWQILEDGSLRYLYNIGARKYARKGARGLELSDQPEAIGMENGKDGIVFGDQTSRQWAFVSNEHLNADQGVVDGIESLTPSLSEGEGAWFDLSGRRVQQPRNGIYIKNGKKVAVK